MDAGQKACNSLLAPLFEFWVLVGFVLSKGCEDCMVSQVLQPLLVLGEAGFYRALNGHEHEEPLDCRVCRSNREV
jgi:hypothetical protein